MHRKNIRLGIVLLAGLGAVVFALKVVGRVNQFALLWPVSGVEIALLIPHWHRRPGERPLALAAAAIGTFLGCILVAMPWWLALQITLFTLLDIYIAISILGPAVQGFEDLKRSANVVRFCAATVAAPLVTGALGTLPVSLFLHEPIVRTFFGNILSNSLGIFLTVPAVLFIVTGEYRSLRKLGPYGKTGVMSMSFFAAVAIFVFRQNFGPFLFIVFPPLIVVLFVLGLEGAVLASVAISAIGWIATSHGFGPLWLIRNASQEQRLMTLQGFVWVFLATALPLGAMLDERRRSARETEEARSIYQTLLDHSEHMIVLSSLQGSSRYVSPAVEKLTGWTPAEYLALDRLKTLHPEDRDIGANLLAALAAGKREHTIRYRAMHKNGGFRWVEAAVRAYGDAAEIEIAGYVATVRDISALKQTEERWQRERETLAGERQRMADLAITDPLTGLLNRRGLDQILAQGQGRRSRDRIALLMIDADFFKLYNDTLGHLAGDECLKSLARVFATRITREGDVVTRFGGEEFAILLRGTDLAGARLVANDILHGVRALALEHPASPLRIVTVSIGVALAEPGPHLDLPYLIQQADRALYASKQAGRNRVSAPEARPAEALA